jgi:hypothetical protein
MIKYLFFSFFFISSHKERVKQYPLIREVLLLIDRTLNTKSVVREESVSEWLRIRASALPYSIFNCGLLWTCSHRWNHIGGSHFPMGACSHRDSHLKEALSLINLANKLI